MISVSDDEVVNRICSSDVFFYYFFFKQKTAYEMRISDWSSDVCSSDLRVENFLLFLPIGREAQLLVQGQGARMVHGVGVHREALGQIGRASCRERVWQYV